MKVAVVFWSGSGNTEVMAESVAQCARSAGAEVDLLKPVQFKSETINSYDAFAFGCPAMGDEVLEEDKFDPMFTAVESDLEGKKAALFGSYGWGDGLLMRNWPMSIPATRISTSAKISAAPLWADGERKSYP